MWNNAVYVESNLNYLFIQLPQQWSMNVVQDIIQK